MLAVDSRGTGRSGTPTRPWTTATCADDVVAVLDDVGTARAHIHGGSLGGMVAQELALRHPSRVGALHLSSTTGGWPRLDFIAPSAIAFFAHSLLGATTARSAEARMRRSLSVWFGPQFAASLEPGHPSWQLLEELLSEPSSARARRLQLIAALRHSSWKRLPGIRAPTLVQHGRRDRIVSWRAGRELARWIPDSAWHMWPDAGHALGLELPRVSSELGLDFIARHDHLLAG